MYTTMIHDEKLEDRKVRHPMATIDLLVLRGLDPVHAANYLIECEGYTREEADAAVGAWLYEGNT